MLSFIPQKKDIDNTKFDSRPKQSLLDGTTTRSGITRRAQFQSIIAIECGVIQEVLPFLRAYRVAPEAGPVIMCTYAGDAGFGIFGSTSQITLPVGATVFFARFPGSHYGTILAVEPGFLTIAGSRKHDELVQGSNVGFISDIFYRTLLANQPPFGGGIPAWEGTHRDILQGEWTHMTETGLAVFLDSMMVGLRVNEYCGIWAHFLDSLLRIAGVNYQLWTGGSEATSYLDWNIFQQYKGYGYTILEQLGVKDPEALRGALDIIQTVDPFLSENPQARFSTIEHQGTFKGETSYVRRFPTHIVQKWEGVLGQGGMTWVFAHPRSFAAKMNSPTKIPRPVAQYGTTRHGQFLVQTINGIMLAKNPYISYPYKKADPDEGYGAPNKNTLEARLKLFLSSTEENPITHEQTQIKCRQLCDIHNLMFNWEAQAGFYLYPNKFYIIKEADLASLSYDSAYGEPGVQWKRHRNSTAYFYIDNHGDIVLQNGAGSRIELIGTTIRITAPKQILIDSGNTIKTFSRDINLLAERKICETSGDCIQMVVRDPYGVVKSALGLTNDGTIVAPNGIFHIFEGVLHKGTVERQSLTGYQHYCITPPEFAYPAQPWVFHAYASGIPLGASRIAINESKPIKPRTVDSSTRVGTQPEVSAAAIESSTVRLFGQPFVSINKEREWPNLNQIYFVTQEDTDYITSTS